MATDELLRRVIACEKEAWTTLVAEIAPQIESIARGHSGLRKRKLTGPDELAEILTATLERLTRDDHRNLRRYLEQRVHSQPQSFDSWLYGAVDFAIRDYLRRRFGRAPKNKEEDALPQLSKRELNTQASPLDDESFLSSLQEALGLTTKLNIAKIFEYIETRFTEQERLAVRLHYAEDKTFAEISSTLGLEDEQAAEKLIRRLNARLRHRFAVES